MKYPKETIRLIQSHKYFHQFDYKIAVDWAINLIREGNNDDSVLMLASFVEPYLREDVEPFLTEVLKFLELEELKKDDALIAVTHYYLLEILEDNSKRKNLNVLSRLCVDNNYEPKLYDFYRISNAWEELTEIGVNFYYKDATLNNIDFYIKEAARKWINDYT